MPLAYEHSSLSNNVLPARNSWWVGSTLPRVVDEPSGGFQQVPARPSVHPSLAVRSRGVPGAGRGPSGGDRVRASRVRAGTGPLRTATDARVTTSVTFR